MPRLEPHALWHLTQTAGLEPGRFIADSAGRCCAWRSPRSGYDPPAARRAFAASRCSSGANASAPWSRRCCSSTALRRGWCCARRISRSSISRRSSPRPRSMPSSPTAPRSPSRRATPSPSSSSRTRRATRSIRRGARHCDRMGALHLGHQRPAEAGRAYARQPYRARSMTSMAKRKARCGAPSTTSAVMAGCRSCCARWSAAPRWCSRKPASRSRLSSTVPAPAASRISRARRRIGAAR